MDVSVVIPTRGRPQKAAACLAALARQSLDADRFEVLIGIDGGADEPEEAEAAERVLLAAWPAARADRLTIERCPQAGQAAVRNRLVRRARADLLVFLNDDVLPEPDLLAAHHSAHRQAAGLSVLIVGAAPWVVPSDDTLFDRLVRETSMVFFYHRMDEALRTGRADPDHDWGFRHAWLLNLSVPASMVRDAGLFTVFPATYGYEDDEFAHRCRERYAARVLYRPGAVARHDHRLTPAEYLAREEKLGFAAWGFAERTPGCARELFGRDVRATEETDYARAFVRREARAADRLRDTFHALATLPADALPAAEHPHAASLVEALYQQHLLLKRWHWCTGLLRAADDA